MSTLKLKIHSFTQLVDMLPGNIYIKDKLGIYLYHNKKMVVSLKKLNYDFL